MGCEASILLDDHRKNECVFVRVGNCYVQVYCSCTKQRCPDKGQGDQHLILLSSLQVHTMKPLKNAVPQSFGRFIRASGERERGRGRREGVNFYKIAGL